MRYSVVYKRSKGNLKGNFFLDLICLMQVSLENEKSSGEQTKCYLYHIFNLNVGRQK